MRISPIAYFYDDLDIILEKTKEATIPSHNNEEAIIGAQAVSTAIFLSRNNYSQQEIKQELERRFNYSFEFNIEDLQHNYRFSSRTIDSVPQAIFCFLESTSFEDCLRTTISIGGDCDTTSAMSCAIAEAFYKQIDYNLIHQTLQVLKIANFMNFESVKVEYSTILLF